MGMSSASFWRLVSFILAILLVAQWILFSLVLSHRHDSTSTAIASDRVMAAADHPHKSLDVWKTADNPVRLSKSRSEKENENVNGGVAVTIMLRAPKWFHRRYTLMMHNVLSNLPSNWKVQVFVNVAWLEKDVLPLHPGMKLLLQKNSTTLHANTDTSTAPTAAALADRIIWTPLPSHMARFKPKQLFKSKWLWESVVAENVLMFGGNGALCANSQYSMERFVKYDYVGAPWFQMDGVGGDGSTHSFRHRSAMLSILSQHPPEDNPQDMDRPDYQYFLRHMLGTAGTYKVADPATTMAFGGFVNNDEAPFLVSGTLPNLNWTVRENVLSTCPEIKMIFPSMHEPGCFGAHPNPAKCKASICALQDKIPPSGC